MVDQCNRMSLEGYLEHVATQKDVEIMWIAGVWDEKKDSGDVASSGDASPGGRQSLMIVASLTAFKK